ncbi:indolepyruvate oxidoreductase subunit beta [Solidesulfovibrio sp.]|uniref:indolepyruvate oxidoreductase subunit beta n=1 Tax=Solidesulfovibrio sp. TaxID=2910990 RepID=UPI002B1FB78A|nr:indolepyruvate oxidoreductase subunit beta [Solidesulfovibrio sp.]MEA4854855.1 indolepyruvate oxidoreductase subunit beta [Solidesulfovibrio sp.]
MQRARIFLPGVGGQGTLTATTLLARTALDAGLPVTSGEIHGMAQRGGVVESTLLIGGYKSAVIAPGEADTLLGFELLETLRALPMLRRGGRVVGNAEALQPVGVCLGRECYPPLEAVLETARGYAAGVTMVPAISLAEKAGTAKAANMVLLGAAAACGALPFDLDALARSVEKYLKPKIVALNRKALELGAAAAQAGQAA